MWLLCLTVLSFYEARVLSIFDSQQDVVGESWGIAHGEAGMQVFQNRIAGPFLVQAVSSLTGLEFAKCHLLFAVAMVFLSNLIPFLVFRHLINNDLAVYALVLLNAAGIVAVHFHGFVMDFDLIDMTTMFLFAFAVFFGLPLWGLVLLFVVELLNREVAGFIALWMIIDGVVSLLQGIHRRALVRIGTGSVLILAGYIWTKFIRGILLKIPDVAHAKGSFQGENVTIGKNLHELMRPSFMLYTLSGLLIFLFIRFAGYHRVPLLHAIKVGLLLAAFMTFLFLFAVMSETRVWLELVPFMVFLYMIPLGLTKAYPRSSDRVEN